MISGIIIAIVISLCWITIQNIWMHIAPAKNRIRAMTIGYAMSLPAVFLICRHTCAAMATGNATEPYGIVLFHAYFLHLLIFLLYAECFYHIERAVTLRVLVQMAEMGDGVVMPEHIMREYNAAEMVPRRLAVLAAHKFIACRQGRWTLRGKGIVFARLMQFSAWLFQSTSQRDRV